jgi:hypothetical protein
MPGARPGRRGWLQRLAWLLLIWTASVAALAVAALAIRLLMRAAGMTA